MIEFSKNMKLHFTGIGGAGMLPLALHAEALGCRVEGSDLSSENFRIFEKSSIRPVKGHGSVSPDTDLLVYSAAVPADDPELVSAANQNIPAVKRAVFLDMVTKDRHTVLVSGSHGKSTVTAMLADMMSGDEHRAAAIVGAETVAAGSNYYPGEGGRMIVEADEYDRSFLRLHPKDLIVLNIDDDHMDIYGDMNGLKKAFTELASKLDENSVLVYNVDDESTVQAVSGCAATKISFGFSPGCTFSAANIKYNDFRTSFDLIRDNKQLCRLEYFYTGRLNVYNMLAAASYLSSCGISGEKIKQLALRFKGVKRRTEIIYRSSSYILVDDYAHHPSEIKASLDNIRSNTEGRLIVMFQPHLYSRTKFHLEGFAKSFGKADLVYISHIYPAREKYDPSVASSDIFDRMDEETKKRTRVFVSFEEVYKELSDSVRPGDVIVSMGAGEINKVLYRLKEALLKK